MKRYYKGRLMKDYKPKFKVYTVESFLRRLNTSRVPLTVRGNEAFDADGDRRIKLITNTKQKKHGDNTTNN